MNIPLCRMIAMLVMHHALKIDVLKMEEAFSIGYCGGHKILYVSPLNWKGKEQFVNSYIDFWLNAH